MNSRSGYTLLEVLVAFAVMAGVLAVVLPGLSAQLRQAGMVQDRFLATSYSQSRLDQLGITEEMQAGRVNETYRGWDVEINISAVRGQSDLPEHYHVDIQIKDGAGRVVAGQETVKVLGK